MESTSHGLPAQFDTAGTAGLALMSAGLIQMRVGYTACLVPPTWD